MNSKAFNFTLLIVWLAIFIGLSTRDRWMAAEMLERVGPSASLITTVAALLTAWNAFRLWVAIRLRRPTRPIAREGVRRRRTEEVTDPQFKFDEPDRR